MRINRKALVVAMLEQNLNQKQLAELAGVSRVTVNGVKNGRSCSQYTGECIAKALSIPLEKLIEK